MLMTTTGSADWQALKAAIDGTLVLADSPEYERVRKPRMVRFQELRPQAIVLCASADDVAATIEFARRHGLRRPFEVGVTRSLGVPRPKGSSSTYHRWARCL
jgi:FAD/FMN-containing dehydrogenase